MHRFQQHVAAFPTAGLLTILLSLGIFAFAQDDPLSAGRNLVAQLKLDQTADQNLFSATGIDRSITLLMAVVTQGQQRNATPADWIALHRATTGMVELSILQRNYLKAAIFSQLQGNFYRNLDHDYTAALEASQKAYDLQQQSGITNTQYVNETNIGEYLLKLNRPAEAIKAFRSASQILPDPVATQAEAIWAGLIDADIANHDLDTAATDLTSFTQLAKSAPLVFQAEALISTGTLRIEQARYSEAVDALKQAMILIADDPKATVVGYEIASRLLGVVLSSIRTLPYDQAIALSNRMDSEFAKLAFPITPVAKAVITMRRRMAGDIDGVLREDTARLQQARADGNIGGQAETLRSLATSFAALHSPSQQATALEQALDLEKQLVASAATAPARQTATYNEFLTMYNLGEARLALRDLKGARQMLDGVLRGIKSIQDAPTRADVQRMYGPASLGLARVLELDEQPDDARDLLTGALTKDNKDFNRGDALLQLARLERDQNDHPAEALKRYTEAIAEMQTEKRTTEEVIARLEFAEYLAGGKSKVPDFAARANSQAVEIFIAAQTANMSDAIWRMDYIQGLAAESGGQNSVAISKYQSAVESLDKVRAGLSQQESRQAFMDSATVDDLNRRLIGLLVAGGRSADAWQYIERGKARSFLEMMQGREFRETTPETQDLSAMEKQLFDLRVELDPTQADVLRSAGKDPDIVNKEMVELQNRFTLARQQAGLSSTRQGELLTLRPSALTDTQRLLPAHTALIEYAFLPDSIAAFVVTRDAEKVVQWKTELRQLKAKVSRSRVLLADANSGAELDPLLEELSAILIQPLIGDIAVDTTNLIIVPAAYLNYLPFQVLPLDAKSRMIDKFAISYLPSASTLSFLKPAPKRTGSLFIGALGNVSVDGWAPLPGTLRESAAIHAAAPTADQLSEASFTHDSLKLALTKYDTVHIATHGILDEHAPLFSALLVSPAPGQPSRLSLYEITDIKMRARVVVLSACQTGVGKLLAGDEITGLTRTFLQAGAETVVSSLWKVSDDSTALLMAGFHARMSHGESAAQALRESAQDVRQEFPHPFYWAPFILTGAR